MSPRALALFVAVILTHYFAPMAETFGINPRFAFYVMRSIEGCVLFWLLAEKQKGFFLLACALGFVLELMVATCGAFAWLEGLMPKPMEQLCDTSTGVPISAITLVALVLTVATITRNRETWQT